MAGQRLAPAQPPAAKAEGAPGDVQALSAHYRFLERYTDDPAKAELLNQYQVACKETIKLTRDNPRGAPDVDRMVVQTIYTERVAKLSKEGQVLEVVRRYDRANLQSTVEIRPYKTKMLEGLTILYTLPLGAKPRILSLTTGRQMREREYTSVTMQTFLPKVTAVLPRQGVRVGDKWDVSRAAAWALLGSQPAEEDYDLRGELVSVHQAPTGTSMTAAITVKGQCLVPQGPSGINANLEFTFEPSSAQATSPTAGGAVTPVGELPTGRPAPTQSAGMFDAKGFFTKISLAQEATQYLGTDNGRLKQLVRRELIVGRRLLAQTPGSSQGVEIPNPAPTPTMQNSWVIYDDPQGSYHLLHPQEMIVDRQFPDGGVSLLDRRPDGQDSISLGLLPKSGDPQRDRIASDPVQEKKKLEDEWKRSGDKVLPGTSGWLPDADWSKLKRRVYRIEAAIMSPDEPGSPPSGRTYVDYYLVQFARNEVLKLTAMTSRDPHVAFRDMAESILRSFEFGLSDSALPAAPTAPPRATPPPPR